MATFLELQTRVQRRIIDPPDMVVEEIPDLINEVILEGQRKHNFAIMRYSVDLTTVAATRILGPFPTNFKAYRGRPFRTSDLGAENTLKLYGSQLAAKATIGSVSTGAPSAIVEGDPVDGVTPPPGGGSATRTRSWEVWPLPDGLSDFSSGEYTITIPYWGFLDELDDDSSFNWFSENAEAWVIAAASAKGFELDWDMQNGPQWEAIAEKEWRLLRNADILAQAGGSDTLVPLQGATDDVDYR